MRPTETRKTILINIGVFVATALVMFGVAELVVRVLFADTTTIFPRYHTNVRYGEYELRRIRPNSDFWHTSIDGSWRFVTNSQGFRNYEDFSYEKAPGTIRVISIGDSHTQGYEIHQDNTFSAVAERYLNVNFETSEVINAGVSGFSTAEALLFVENEGVRYEPDVVMLGFYQNDFEDNIKTGLFELGSDGGLVAKDTEYLPGVGIQNVIYAVPGVKWLSENSYFYSVLFNATWNYAKDLLTRAMTARQPAIPEAEETQSARPVPQFATTEYAIATKQSFSDHEVGLAAALLQRLYRFCQDNGIKLVVIDIPARDRENNILSSIPPELRPVVTEYSDAFIDTTALLAPFNRVAQIHLPHGHQHISEFTHTMIGVAAAEQITELLSEFGTLSSSTAHD